MKKKNLLRKVTWKKALAGLFLLGSFGVGAYNVYLYQTQTWFDKLLGFFS